jgi:DNA replication protein DnaC
LPKRALEWALFCEINTIGDENHGVTFDSLQQGEGKVSYLLKFCNKPRGIILMQGDPGTGKTFSAMAACELFTRKSDSCLFFTQKQMRDKWLIVERGDESSNFNFSVETVNLLVVDDFGTADVTPPFMGFFMDLINSRMQWTDRGTIITTNLDDDKFFNYCGQALTSRINMGQKFVYKGPDRRSPKPL